MSLGIIYWFIYLCHRQYFLSQKGNTLHDYSVREFISQRTIIYYNYDKNMACLFWLKLSAVLWSMDSLECWQTEPHFSNFPTEGKICIQDRVKFYFILFYFVLFCFILFYLFYFILFYFILFYFILFYFVLFYFILFYRSESIRNKISTRSL